MIILCFRLNFFLLIPYMLMPTQVKSISFDWQSSTNLSDIGYQFSPVNYQALVLIELTSKSLFSCTRTCHSTSRCRIFDYDGQAQYCRLFEGDIATMGSFINSASPQSRVGSLKIHQQQFINRGQPCSFCQGSRYLRCLNNTCQCQINTYFDGSICQSQKLLGAICYNTTECRQDLNYTCLARQQCGLSSMQTADITAGNANGSPGSTSYMLYSPTGLTLGIDNALYVADYGNHRVIKFPEGSANGSLVAGTGFPGNSFNQLDGPTGIHVDVSSNVYVADSRNYRIMLWKKNSSVGIKVAGTGASGTSLSDFGTVAGIFVDSQGYIYLCDSNHHRVMKFSPNNTIGVILGGTGLIGSGSNQLNTPYGIYYDEVHSYVYVADSGNNRIQRFHVGVSTNGTTIAGGNGAGSGSNQLSNPYSICISEIKNIIYIADPGNQRIQRWYLGATSGVTIAGNGASTSNASTSLLGPMDIRININNTYIFVSELQYNRVAQRKFIRLKQNVTKKRRSLALPITHQRSIFKNFLARDGDSLIHVPAHDHHSQFKQIENDKQHNIVTINVSGNRYQTHLSTLENYPNTLLGNEQKREYYWNSEEKEYFFDRHRACFEAILYYYQSSGRLRRPDYVPLDTFLEEVSFFDLGPNALSQINKLENVSIVKYIHLPTLLWRRYIWFYLEYPQHSMFAKILHFISMTLTVLSCIELAVETIPEYNNKWNKLCEKEENRSVIGGDIPICSTMFSSPFFIIQTICVSYFTVEFLLRAIVPYFVFLSLALVHKTSDLSGNGFVGLRVFRILRFLRVFKVYLIFKRLKTLRVLSSTLKESFIDFIIMIVILTLMGFLFGATVYFVEQDVDSNVFDSIPKATYWGILTITTVGYGDMYPVTVIGRILACACAFCGVAISGMLVSVLVDRYQRVYNRKQFFPEQILSAIDSSTTEQDEKQDFINKRLSASRRTLTGGLILPIVPTQTKLSSTNSIKYSKFNNSSSHVRFIISIHDHHTSMHDVTNELMKELTNIIQNSGEPIELKLRTSYTDLSDDNTPTINELVPIPE
ncbi:hypothetical protein I4U23_021693 [Adineta vaga]|nr:hypothetical protein I4U23_021693 [Adineta vaga]